MRVRSCNFVPRKQDLKLINNQLFKANKYRNKLMELYLDRVKKYRALRLEHFPSCTPLIQQCDVLETAVQAERNLLQSVPRAARDTHPLAENVRRLYEELTTARKELRAHLKDIEESACAAAKAEFSRRFKEKNPTSPYAMRYARIEILSAMLSEPQWSEFWKATKRLDDEYRAACEAARSTCELSVGTYLSVEDAHDRAIKTSKMDPGFRRFRGDGILGHQCNKNIVTPNMLQVRWPETEREMRPEHQWGWAKFNIGSLSEPIWVEGRISLKEFPVSSAKIKWLYLSATKSGIQQEFYFRFTTDEERPTFRGEGIVALNIGWRRLPNNEGVRVAYAVDDRDNAFEIRLPERIIRRERYAAQCLSHRDNHFNKMRDALVELLRDPTVAKPEWATQDSDEVKFMHLWRSPDRLSRFFERWMTDSAQHAKQVKILWRLWKRERLACGLELWADSAVPMKFAADILPVGKAPPLLFALFVWKKQEDHMHQGGMRGKMKVAASRREVYLVAARRLAETYDTVIVGPHNLSRIIKKKRPENDTSSTHDDNAASIRQLSAPGMLREICLRHANAVDGVIKDITSEHFGCGGKTKSDPKLSIMLKCTKCGLTYDQDRNAALHLLHRARKRLSEGLPPGIVEGELIA